MTASTEIELEFGDGKYVFRLGLAQINELQNKCGCGIGALYARVLKGRYSIEGQAFGHPLEADYHLADAIEPIRQGLMGGKRGEVDGVDVNVTDALVNRLIATYVFPERPIADAWALSASILMAAIDGYEPPKKKDEDPATKTVGSTTRKRSPTVP